MIGALLVKRTAARSFEALNRRDLEAFLKAWADNATFVYPGDLTDVSGTFVGKAACWAWFERFLEQFPVLHFTVKHVSVSNLFAMTGSNVVAITLDVNEMNREGASFRNSGVTIVTVQQGKAVYVQDYLFQTGEEFREAWGQGKRTESLRP